MRKILGKYIGDRTFYKKVFAVSIPIMIQNAITNFVSLLDNIMVGRLGTEEMSGVAIVNQLFFVYYLALFGAIAGAGIFTAQYFGNQDDEGVRYTFRFKLIICTVIIIATAATFLLAGDNLINMYLSGSDDGGDIIATHAYGHTYMLIMLAGLPAMMLSQVYSGTLRECGRTFVPMVAGLIAVFINLIFNYLLIYGALGFPEMGVGGAALATVISRWLEASIVIIWTHRNKRINTYIVGMYSSFRIPKDIVFRIIKKGTPLLLNETLWSMGMAALMQCYSVRGLSVVAGMNMCNTVVNVFYVVFFAMGDAVAILVGQLLGAGKMNEARDTARKLITLGVFSATVLAFVVFLTSGLFPLLYNVDNNTRELAAGFIIIAAIFMPQNAFLHASYFTIRSGGKTVVTFLFDSGFLFTVTLPVAYVLANFTSLGIFGVYFFVQLTEGIKSMVAYILIKKGVWVNNIIN